MFTAGTDVSLTSSLKFIDEQEVELYSNFVALLASNNDYKVEATAKSILAGAPIVERGN